MRVEVINVSSQLLVSNILDTSASYVAQRLYEEGLSLTRRITVGDELKLIIETIQIARRRVPVIIIIGNFVVHENNLLWQALNTIYHPLRPDSASTLFLYGPNSARTGLMIANTKQLMFILPQNRYTLTYVLEAIVLPFLRRHLRLSQRSNWALLRTVGIMESTLKEYLTPLINEEQGRLVFHSFAGQTTIRLWVTGATAVIRQQKLAHLKTQVLDKIGEFVYGEESDQLERIVLQMLRQQQRTLTIAEFFTDKQLQESLSQDDGQTAVITPLTTTNPATVADELQHPPLNQIDDLSRWCRMVAQQMVKVKATNLGLLLYNHYTQGGVQVLVTLATPTGISAINRSFNGHPEHINHWAINLGLGRLYHWLRGHEQANE